MLQPLLQAQGGDEQDLPAAGIPVLPALGHKGLGRHVAGQLGLGDGEGEGDFQQALSLREHLGPAALIGQSLHVKLRDQQPAVEPVLRQQRAVFRDHLMGAEHHVGSGLALAGAGVHVAAQQLGGLHGYQLAAVAVLSDEVVAGRQIADDSSPRLGQPDGGRVRRPQVLANLKAQHQVRDLPAGEQDLRCKGDGLLSAQCYRARHLGCRGELALLVKFPVVGDMGLGHHAQNLSLLDNSGAIIQLLVHAHRQAHRRHHLQIPGGLQHRGQRLLSTPQQGFLIEQVAAGIAGEPQLR